MGFKVMILICLVSVSTPSMAQSSEQEVLVREILENMAERLNEDYDLTEVIENLVNLRKNPIDLNHTNEVQLNAIVFLSPLQIHNLLKYIKDNGNLIDVLELQTIDGFDTLTVQNLLPFVTINSRIRSAQLNWGDFKKNGQNEFLLRYGRLIETQKGFTDLTGNKYLGSPEKFQMRYKFYYASKIFAGFTMEKDAGEKFFGKPTDFVSASASVALTGKLNKFVVGDYSLQFGQGLTLWSGFAFGKGADVTSVVKKDLGLKPYTSTNEYAFLRGISLVLKLTNSIQVIPFVSFRKLDASQEINNEGVLVQSSINETGLHRTATEIAHKNVLEQQVLGSCIQYARENWKLGAIFYKSHYGNAFIPQNTVYDHYAFTGQNLTNAGIFYNYTIRNIYLYGEFASSVPTGTAFIQGILLSISPAISFTLNYRSYGNRYYNLLNKGLSESGSTNNEQGLYTALNFMPNKKWSFSCYLDRFRFPWLKYRTDAPSKGYELASQLSYTPKKTVKFSFRYKAEQKQQNTDGITAFRYLSDVFKTTYRLETSWQYNQLIKFQTHVETSSYIKSGVSEHGYLVYQDLAFNPPFRRLSSNIRIAYFNTPSYNSRIYAYEDDVLYSFAFGTYSGRGYRSYLNIKYKLSDKCNIWTRYAIYHYPGVNTVGTYLDEINGNKKSDVKIQLRYQF